MLQVELSSSFKAPRRLADVLGKHWTEQRARRTTFSFLLLVCITSTMLLVQLIHLQYLDHIILPVATAILVLWFSIAFAVSLLASHKAIFSVAAASVLVLISAFWMCFVFGSDRPLSTGHCLATLINIIIVAYLFLADAWIHAILCGVTSELHIIMLAVTTHATAGFYQNFSSVVFILIAVNGLGLAHCFSERRRKRELIDHLKTAVSKRTIMEHEKERQEQLLLSIIPPYLAEQVKQQLMQRASKTQGFQQRSRSMEAPKLFHDLHVQLHHNVSILFSDIVNFTPLTTTLTAAQLVDTLNALYARFDQLAGEHQIMRIKILGDCYYCVSGMPINRPNHADNCVRMGLSMIKAIAMVRDATTVDVDMRIGVHTGDVLCGILGLRKWQYDIWSDDVTIANNMESAGSPGKVHITSSTLANLSGDYEAEDASGKRKPNECLDSMGIRSFFISPASVDMNSMNGGMSGLEQNRRVSSCSAISTLASNTERVNTITPTKMRSKLTKVAEFWGADTPFSKLARHFSSDVSSATSLALIEDYLNNEENVWLNRKTFSLSACVAQWNKQKGHRGSSGSNDPVPESLPISWLALAGLSIVFTVVIINSADRSPLTIALLIFVDVLTVLRAMIAVIFLLKRFASRQRPYILRSIALSVLFILLLITSVIFPLVQNSFIYLSFNGSSNSPALYILCCCQLVLIYTGLLRRLACIFRCCLIIAITLLCVILLEYRRIHQQYQQHHFQQQPFMFDLQNETSTLYNVTSISTSHIHFYDDFTGWASLLVLLIILLFQNFLERQEHKADWGCLESFRSEQEDVETMQDINNILLSNILPEHVAQHFLSADRKIDTLYHENHEAVCVMFASIPNFQEFWRRFDNEHKLECLRLLNEIVCEFDIILSKPKFSSVEKIKTVGSTYMLASGLHPAASGHKHRLTGIMVEFALSMMNSIDLINRDAFQSFQLRFGICYGPVIAGVIGAQKPQFDIWGHTVNMASRMDTYSERGKIHVTEATADALISCGYSVESRGKMRIKGVKDPIETFFVQIDR